MGQPYQIMYRYNGDEWKNEVVVDIGGEETLPKMNQIIRRKGGAWKVVMVSTHASPDGSLPIHFVSLTDKF